MAAGAAALVGVAVIAVAASVPGAATSGPGGSGPVGSLPAGVAGPSTIPPAMLLRYEQAAASCPGLPWTVLAAIGTVESGNDTSSLPGVASGANPAGAEGPMQFEPATFAAYDAPIPPGGADPASPYDPTDAVWAAARMLCADGAGTPAGLAGAVLDYDHSSAYVREVLALAGSYAASVALSPPSAAPPPPGGAGPAGGASPAAGLALAWALAQIGTPYEWGGETAGVSFDCSGLTQAAYAAAGVALPRVAQAQWQASPHLPAGQALEPGDLVFFGGGPTDVEHVGMVVADHGATASMVDAPHTGADVRVEDLPTTPGAAFGSEVYVGATRPAP